VEAFGQRPGVWRRLGAATGFAFRAAPPCSFACGALENPEVTKPNKAKAKRARDEDDEAEETRYETVDFASQGAASKKKTRAARGGDADGDDDDDAAEVEEATNRRLQRLHATLVDTAADTPVDLVGLVVDPTAFHATVENLFDLSFLVKDGRARLAMDAGLPTCVLDEQPNEAVEKTQTVVVVGPNDTKDLAALWGIETATLARN